MRTLLFGSGGEEIRRRAGFLGEYEGTGDPAPSDPPADDNPADEHELHRLADDGCPHA